MSKVSANMNRLPKYEFHRLANCWPLADKEDHAGLVESIKDIGLREKIVLYEGKILDGRNRYNACVEAGVKPLFETLGVKEDPIKFVEAKNSKRRHLSISQKAMAGAKLKEYYDEQAQIRMLSGVKSDPGVNLTEGGKGRARDQVGAAVGVSGSSIQMAESVLAKGAPEVVEAVERGELRVSAAKDLVQAIEDPEEQAKVLKAGPKAVKAEISKVRTAKVESATPIATAPRADKKPEVAPAAPLLTQLDAILQRVDKIDALHKFADLDGSDCLEKALMEIFPQTMGAMQKVVELKPAEPEKINTEETAETGLVLCGSDPERDARLLFDSYEKHEQGVVYQTVTDLWLFTNDQAKGKKKSGVFVKPTIEEVKAYCEQRGKGVDAERFYDYYSAQGWKLSNGIAMKDWQAAVRNWEKSPGSKTAGPAKVEEITVKPGILPPAEEKPLKKNMRLDGMFKKLEPVALEEC